MVCFCGCGLLDKRVGQVGFVAMGKRNDSLTLYLINFLTLNFITQ